MVPHQRACLGERRDELAILVADTEAGQDALAADGMGLLIQDRGGSHLALGSAATRAVPTRR